MNPKSHQPFSYALVCSVCGAGYSPAEVQTYAPCCGHPLLAQYNLVKTAKEALIKNLPAMWRYGALLPVQNEANLVSLGEGFTPVLPLNRLAGGRLASLLLKDESCNPTGSFKARGLSVAVSKAKELGLHRLIIPTAGNAGGALAAYCAKAGLQCTVVMPLNTPPVFKQECRLFGADLIEVPGLINDCAAKVEALKKGNDWFDVSTLKEPYRLEGKKTMGYEIAEQLNWQLPDVIVYPAGGGTGLIGIWKAFAEMQQLGWVSGPLPRMIAVQAQNCAPLAAALQWPETWRENFHPKASIAYGLAVPYPFGLRLMLRVIADSGGEVVTVSEAEIAAGIKEVARAEGLLLSPEGSAVWKAVENLLAAKKIGANERVLLLNTGSAYKYAEVMMQV